MAKKAATQLLAMGALFLASSVRTRSACPDSKWFGSRCQFMCHCQGSQCEPDGSCKSPSTCEEGWFGPACQYVDVMAESDAPSWLKDNNDQTCNPSRHVTKLVIKLTVVFSWLKYVVQNSHSDEVLKLEFDNRGCNNQTTFFMSESIVEVRCAFVKVEVNEVILSGKGVSEICSLHISGGRNVALKSNAQMDHCYQMSQGNYAVNGNRSIAFHWSWCAHSLLSGGLVVYFAQPSQIIQYVIYNRQDDAGNRLRGFRLQGYNAEGNLISQYQEQDSQMRKIYYVRLVATGLTAVAKIQAAAGSYLNVCEFEAYGDSECEPGKYGIECEKTCNCLHPQNLCHRSGACVVACPPGRKYLGCTKECADGTYGINCKKNCVNNCLRPPCRKTDGLCIGGCVRGISPPECLFECVDGAYGSNCSDICSNNCFNLPCRKSDGMCFGGCTEGFKPPNCHNPCEEHFYGINCTQTCSAHCRDSECNYVTGICHGCNPGYTGDSCEKTCPVGFFGQDCSEPCPEICQDCQPDSGNCTSCAVGLTGPDCRQKCPDGLFGKNCAEKCPKNCLGSKCDHVLGLCGICEDGFQGGRCDLESPLSHWTILKAVAVIVSTFAVVMWLLRPRREILPPGSVSDPESAKSSDSST